MTARGWAVAALTCLSLAIAGCGLEGDDEQAPSPRAPTRTTTTTTPAQTQPARPLRPRSGLPQPTAGVVEVNGEETGSLTGRAVRGYNARGGSVRQSTTGATGALAQLCRGEIDVADSARPISFREFEACRRNGLALRTFPAASDAVVVAIRNETDVGADCLTISQVKRIFENGSTIESWQDVSPDYFDVPLVTTGPNEEANAFDYFTQRVLDVTESATLSDLRSDYIPHPTDDGTRRTVVGERRSDLDRFILELDRRRRALDQRVADLYETIVPLDRRIKSLDRRIRELDAIIGAGVDPEERDLKRTRDRLARRRAAYARRRAVSDRERRRSDRRRRELVQRLLPLVRQARLRERRRRGVVGLFRFSFYEQYEQQLRPFEIEDDEGRNRCVFPSQTTITGGTYPLARRLLLFTTQRSLARAEVNAFLRYYLENSRDFAISERLVPNADPQVLEALEEIGPAGGGQQERPRTPQGGGTQTTPQQQGGRPQLPSSDDGPSYRREGGGER